MHAGKGRKSSMKKTTFPSEGAYIAAMALISLAVAMVAASNFGVSMIVGPAYILSLRFPALSFGQWEYVIQGGLFAAMCLILRRVRPVYLFSFLSCLIYGAALDAWRRLPALNPAVTMPGSQPMPLRIACFVCGTVLTALAVALYFKAYLYPQVYDFFVKAVSRHLRKDRTRFKIGFDAGCLILSVALSLMLFGRVTGIGVGTIITTCVNGLLIGLAEKLLDRFFLFRPAFPALAKRFEMD